MKALKTIGIVIAIFVVMAIIALTVCLFIAWPSASEAEKTMFIIAILAVVAGGTVLIGAPLLIIALFAQSANKTNDNGEEPIIRNVPANHAWVLRSILGSNPNTGAGYEVKREGFAYRIPVLQSDEGLVSLVPVQQDVEPFTVNCTDGNDVDVDARVTWFVKTMDVDIIRYFVNTKGVDLKELICQRVKVALNRSIDDHSSEAVSWSSEKKKEYSGKVTKMANELLTDDAKKNYGIEIVINVENIAPPPAVKAAADRKEAAKLEREAAVDEAQAAKTMITETGANPTVVMVAQTIADALRGRNKKSS